MDNIKIGNVIRILDEYQLIINAGKAKLNVGDIIQVYETGEPILDLDGTVLNDYIFVKDELEVITVQNNYSICCKNKTITKTIRDPFALSPMLERTIIEHPPLLINKSDIQPLSPIDPIIHIGDPVKMA